MKREHPKAVRRRLLLLFYEHYLTDPLDLLSPAQVQQEGCVSREELQPNVFYLYDRGLLELMTSYNPPFFSGARITADGIDLVENFYEFNRRFPAGMGEFDDKLAEVPTLVERLVDEADFAPLDGERRKCLLRDVQFLRDELVRPVDRWRPEVIHAVLDWIDGHFKGAEDDKPAAVEELRELLIRQVR